VVDGVAAAATAIPLIVTATATLLIATAILSDILALTMDGTLATITPIVGPMAIRIVDRPTSLFRGEVNCLTNIKETVFGRSFF
jgi:hypothetical protein